MPRGATAMPRSALHAHKPAPRDCKACLQGAVLKLILHSLTYDGPGTWTLRDLAEAVAPEG